MTWTCPDCVCLNETCKCKHCGKRWHPFIIDECVRRLPAHWWVWRLTGLLILRPWRMLVTYWRWHYTPVPAMRHAIVKWAEGLSEKPPIYRPVFLWLRYVLAEDYQGMYDCRCCHYEHTPHDWGSPWLIEEYHGRHPADDEYYAGGTMTCARCGHNQEWEE